MQRKFSMLLVLVLTLSLVFCFAANAWADDAPALPPLPYYGEFSGIVTSIEPWANADGSESEALLVWLENDEGGEATFIVDEATHMLTENELKEGAVVTGYYLRNLPMILIYPPRYHAMLMAVDIAEGSFIKVARFDEDLISDDNTLKLNIGEKNMVVVSPDAGYAARC